MSLINPHDKPPPSYAAMYAASYPDLVAFFRQRGYALAVHGSLRRDFDLIAVPWIEQPMPAQTVIDELTTEFAFNQIGEPGQKLHGRKAWSISIGHGHCAIDISFFPNL